MMLLLLKKHRITTSKKIIFREENPYKISLDSQEK